MSSLILTPHDFRLKSGLWLVFCNKWFAGDHGQLNSQVLWLQNKAKSWTLHHHVWQLVWSFRADMLGLVLSKNASVHYDQHLDFGFVCQEDIVPDGILRT